MQAPMTLGQFAFEILKSKAIADQTILKAMESSKTEVAQKSAGDSENE